MIHSSLENFIAHARQKGMDHQTIRLLLLSSGWKEKDVAEALASQTLEVPVPLPPDAGSARDAFFHLLSFTSLIATITSLIFLFLNFLNRWLPDAAFQQTYFYDDGSSIRWQLAILLVSFPLFLWMTWLLQKEYTTHREKLGSGIRRWLTYLTLFIAACVLIGDLIALLYSLLQGEVSLRFLLKVIVILILAGMPFGYYLRAMRLQPDNYGSTLLHSTYRWASVGIVLFAVVVGFFVAGSPLYGRDQRFDEVRLTDLRAIQGEIQSIALGDARYGPTPPTALQNPLPATLDDVLQKAVYMQPNIRDPETDEPYVYNVVSNTAYELCATFSIAREQTYDIFWNHPAGQHCYQFDALDTQTR